MADVGWLWCMSVLVHGDEWLLCYGQIGREGSLRGQITQISQWGGSLS